MANQDSPLERLGMNYNLSPPWISFNMVMALNLGLLIIPPEQSTMDRGKALLMVNDRATYQRQSWIPDAPTGKQEFFIFTGSNENHLVPDIIEEDKLYFNPCIISLMYIWGPENHTTWDVP